jgi:demethylmenaquinone methyltransferase/2-methoxy-6-polyprenyl-1,4-benzoquinol methylase
LQSDRIGQKEWKGIVETIEDAADYYQRMNRLVTFFRVDGWRRRAAQFSGENLDVLEIGCGPGDFTALLHGKRIVCVEPSEKLIGIAKGRIDSRAEFRLGEAESLPVESDSFDRVFCSFSFRDFRDKEKALREIFRVLRKGGQLVILEIGKPEAKVKLAMMNLHLRYDVPFIARFVVPHSVLMARGENMYKDLWMSYQKYLPAKAYAGIMRGIGFIDVAWEDLTYGGGVLLRGSKP